MVQTVENIYNLALSAAGSRAIVASASENSREALLCTIHYELVRDNVMKAASWPSLKQHAVLALRSERDWKLAWTFGDPMPEYTYSYALPSDMLAPRRLASWAKFEIGLDVADRSLHTQDSVALLQYTQLVSDPVAWDQGLYAAVAATLAAQIAFALTKKVSIAKQLNAAAFNAIAEMNTLMANEQDARFDGLPEELTARYYSSSPSTTRYMFPHDVLLGVAV